MLNRDALAAARPIDSREVYDVLEAESELALGQIAMIDGLLEAKAALDLSEIDNATEEPGGRREGRT